jgi:hypothetical protein
MSNWPKYCSINPGCIAFNVGGFLGNAPKCQFFFWKLETKFWWVFFSHKIIIIWLNQKKSKKENKVRIK